MHVRLPSCRLSVLFAIASAAIAFAHAANSQECDFDADRDCDMHDVDLFVVTDLRFDLTGDGMVDYSDRDEWLSLAGMENGFAGPTQLDVWTGHRANA